MSKLTSNSHHYGSDVQSKDKLRMVQSGIHDPSNSCSRCQVLEQQLHSKDTQILELKTYQKYLLDELKGQDQEILPDEIRTLRRQLYDLEIKEIKIKQQLDQAQADLQSTERKLNIENTKNYQLSQQNTDLRRQLLNLEQKLLEHPLEIIQKYKEENFKIIQQSSQDKKFINSLIQMVKSCHPENYFREVDPTLKETWKWFKNVLQEYMQLKQKNKIPQKQNY